MSDWVLTTIETYDSGSVFKVYWADRDDGWGDDEWMCGLEPCSGRARLYSSNAEAKAAYREVHGTVPKEVRAERLSDLESLIARSDPDYDFDGDWNYIGPGAQGTSVDLLVEVTLTRDEAQAVTERIRNTIDDLVWDLIFAWKGRAWEALGYDSWDAWIDGEFDGIPLALPRARRDTTMQSMKQAGLTTRAIASATGVNQATVSRATGKRSVDANASSEHEPDDAVHRAATVMLAQPNLSQREVAAEIGCSVGTANKARKLADGVLEERAQEQAERDKPQPPKPAHEHMADCNRIIQDLGNAERWLKSALKHALELDTVDEHARAAIECYLPSIIEMTAAIGEVGRAGSLDDQLAKLTE